MKSLLHTLLLSLTLLIGASSIWCPPEVYARKRQPKSTETADQRKADYIYLEAKRQMLQENNDAFFELLDYAHRLNPSDKYLGAELSVYYLQLDTSTVEHGMKLLEDYVTSNRNDLYKNYLFATLATRIGDADRAITTWRALHNNFPTREPLTYRYAEALQSLPDSTSRIHAIALYDSLSVTGANPIDIAGRKASIYYSMGDTAAIINTINQLIEKDPNNPDYNVYAGQIYQAFFNADSALNYFDRALQLDPDNGMAYYAKANFYSQRNDNEGYDRETFNALQQVNLDLDVKLGLLRDYVVKLYTDTLQQPRIRELFDTLVEIHPHESTIHDYYAEYLILIKDYPAAVQESQLSIDLEPSELHKWMRLTTLLFQLDEYDRAAETAARARHFFPDEPVLAELEANAYILNKDYMTAITKVDEGIALTDPKDTDMLGELWTLRGDCLYHLDRTEEAFENYNKALEYTPESAGLLNNVAYNKACLGEDLDYARSTIEKAMMLDPENPVITDTYAWVLFKLKDYAAAKQQIDHTIELYAAPENKKEMSAEIYEHAGDIYFMNGDFEAALDFWKDALELAPDNELLKKKVTHKTYFNK